MQAFYPPAGFYFKLELTGVATAGDAAFQEVSGLSAEIDAEEIKEGGENRFNYKFPSTPKYSNLVLKRGVMDANSILAVWCQGVIQSDLTNPIMPKALTLTLLNEQGSPLTVWNFVNAWPVNINTSGFKSQPNELVIETLEFAYSYFNRVL